MLDSVSIARKRLCGLGFGNSSSPFTLSKVWEILRTAVLRAELCEEIESNLLNAAANVTSSFAIVSPVKICPQAHLASNPHAYCAG